MLAETNYKAARALSMDKIVEMYIQKFKEIAQKKNKKP